MDDALKAMMIAIAWSLIFFFLALWRLLFPSYTDAVYQDVRFLRSYFSDIGIPSMMSYELCHKHISLIEKYKRRVPKGRVRRSLNEIYDSLGKFYLFHTGKFLRPDERPEDGKIEELKKESDETFPKKVHRRLKQIKCEV